MSPDPDNRAIPDRRVAARRACLIVEDVHNFFKWASTWVTAAWTALLTWLISDAENIPHYLNQAWAAVPVEIKSIVPHKFMAILFALIFAGSFYGARLVNQKKKTSP